MTRPSRGSGFRRHRSAHMPCPRSMKIGSRPIWRIALTGELTPPREDLQCPLIQFIRAAQKAGVPAEGRRQPSQGAGEADLGRRAN